jgi:predicted Rossmann fold nucleotide-binding protein DprA/Smf involved in DNA uptake
LSVGPHALLRTGAPLVRGAEDVLELLAGPRMDHRASAATSQPTRPALSARLSTILELVGSGCDTPDRLEAHIQDHGDLLLGLSELELMGLLARGDAGRYITRQGMRAG